MARIAITGSTGLIGTALKRRLEGEGHTVVPIRRGSAGTPAADWDPAQGWIREGVFEGVDGAVHLAGASIGEGRWSAKRKAELRSSRVEATRLLVDHLASLSERPRVLVTPSGVGYYGNGGDALLSEDSPQGEGFLASLTGDWEREALRAQETGVRSVVLRLGIVLAREGGALPRMLTPFRFGVGGRLGSGRQWMSWIALDDAVGAIEHGLNGELAGVYNAVAPNPVRNREFTAALAKALHRPAVFPIPGPALRLVIGAGAEELLLWGQRVDPARLQASGFAFRYPELGPALEAILRPERKAA
jgi:uncharacterized protein (TIGR01777 family)